MSTDAAELNKEREELGVTVMEIAKVADLHVQTVYKVLGNYGVSNRNTVNRVRKAITELKASQNKGKAVG